MLFFYQSNERLTFGQRIIATFKSGLLIFLSIVAYFVLTAIWMRDISVPEEVAP